VNRLIITGANGFIGKNLVKKLLSNNFQSLTLLSNTPSIEDKYLSDWKFVKDKSLRFYTADIRDKKSISEIFQIEKADTCIHLAAKISVADSIINVDETMDINVNGTLNVLEASSKSKVNNFVFASSAAVYGDVRELPISENAPIRPLSPYGKSKMFGEELVLRYDKLKKIQNTISLRIFNVYGRGNVNQSDVISKFAARVSRGLPPIIHGDGNHTRDFVSVDDVVDAILLSIKAMETNYNANFNFTPVFNIGSGVGTSTNQLACKMIKISGLDIDPIYEKGTQNCGVILHSYSDITKAKTILKFVAKKDLETGLRELIGTLPSSK
jgi:nucleoside-diphosphate-sugar epimerase